jgi:hypothetical protein
MLRDLGRLDEGRPLMVRGMASRRRRAEGESASGQDKLDAALDFLECEYEDLRDPAVALVFAEATRAMIDAPDPTCLEILSRARFGKGDVAGAIETRGQAIALVPEDEPRHAEWQALLDEWKKAAGR